MPAPLAEILRPRTLEDYVGQQHLTGEGGAVRQFLETGTIPSMIFWGTPGIGKTTLAGIIAAQSGKAFFQLSAVQSGVKDVREVIQLAKNEQSPILFIDEIHRFSKSQQDSLLAAVEQGIVTLIGATTENPSFEVIQPLLSRCQVYTLEPLSAEDLLVILNKAVSYYAENGITLDIRENQALLALSGGDARKLYNSIEMAVAYANSKNVVIDNKLIEKVLKRKAARYDKNGEMHYDIISAFIKSMRNSDPNAAVYWMARMLEGGEDPVFIARRMLILASEDIGLANPNALLMANACFDAVHKIGMPEARIILSQCAVYLASSAKSNSTYLAINDALAEVRKSGDLPVPLHLRNAPTKLMKYLGYGSEYRYAHDYNDHFIEQECMPEKLSGKVFYKPGENAREKELKQFLVSRWKDRYRF